MDTWAGQAANWTWNNVQDVARIGFGTFDVSLGGSMIWTGACTLPGIGLIAIGLDQLATGAMNLRYGRIGQGFSIIEFGAYSATGDATLAILTPGLLSLGFWSLGSVGRAGVRAGAEGDVTFFRSTFQSGPYAAGRFGRGGELWQTQAVYRAGQVRTEWLVHEAGRWLGVRVRLLADEILYIPGARAPFFAVVNGRRFLALNRSAVNGSDETLRLLKAIHEVGHARVYGNPGLFGRMSYAAEEIFVESTARMLLAPYLTRSAFRNSIKYENFWRAAQGFPPLPVPP